MTRAIAAMPNTTINKVAIGKNNASLVGILDHCIVIVLLLYAIPKLCSMGHALVACRTFAFKRERIDERTNQSTFPPVGEKVVRLLSSQSSRHRHPFAFC